MELLKKILKSLLIGSLVGIGVVLVTKFCFQDFIDRLENGAYYQLCRWALAKPSKDELAEMANNEYGIHIVDIDDRSMQKLGLYWNWDRSYHADMINALAKHFPAAIVFDIMFSDPEDENQRGRLQRLLERSHEVDPSIELSDRVRESIVKTIDYDEKLIEATKKAGNVYHGIRLADELDYPAFALSQVKYKMTMAWHDSLGSGSAATFPPEVRKKIPKTDNKTIIDGIFPALARAARGIGHVNIVPNDDGVIRETPLCYTFGDNDPVYFPISVRTVASLFATPNEEISLVPGRYIDIGKPFKIFKDSAGTLSYSYPNFTTSQAKAIIGKSKEILSLGPNALLDVSSFCAASRDSAGHLQLELSVAGVLPPEVTDALVNADLTKALALKPKEEYQIAPSVTMRRDTESDWVVRAPFGDQEWGFTRVDLLTISQIVKDDLAKVTTGHRTLIFHTVTVKNHKNHLETSIPCLRDQTLKELCCTGWDRIKDMPSGTRMDFGQNVKIPLTPDNQHIITYFGPKKVPFPYYSYYDILKDRVQGSLEGKIFIVGSSTTALFDIKAVPHDQAYPAVEVHASLMNSFLRNTFVTRLERWQDLLILLLVGIGIGFISYFLKPLLGGILSILSMFFYCIGAMMLFQQNYLWIEVARPLLTIIITFTTVMAYRYITEEKDRKFLQSTFKQYLSPDLIDIMYKQKQQPKLGGDEGIRTAYFTDIQGFSTFSEKLDSPTRLVDLLNEYLTEMTDILLAHFGTLDKYEGDAIIAFFGAPMPMEDHAYQACCTALDMQAALGELRKKSVSEGDKWPESSTRCACVSALTPVGS